MKFPKLKEIPTVREMVDVFRGYNHNLRIGDGEFYDIEWAYENGLITMENVAQAHETYSTGKGEHY